jgi:DNA-binding response OmpR family regulator
MKMLLVEDDPKSARLLSRGLTEEGFEVRVATSAEEADRRIAESHWDIVVLDWMLPGEDGLGLCRRLRARSVVVPVLMLTARDAVEDRVSGLEGGADDYLTKPFAFEELLARIHALVRRSAMPREPVIAFGDLRIDPVRQRAARADAVLDLTPKEYAILEVLARHAGEVVSRELLAGVIRKEGLVGIDNLIDVHIGNLRRKVEAAEGPRLIETVRGVGFRLSDATAH